MSRTPLQLITSPTSAAERSRQAAESARTEAYAALEDAMRAAERASALLFDTRTLALLPHGLRYRAETLAAKVSSEVNSMSALSDRLRRAG